MRKRAITVSHEAFTNPPLEQVRAGRRDARAGLSGSAVDSRRSSAPEKLYKPAIDVAKGDGKTRTSAMTYHSEPMASTFHNQDRPTPVSRREKQIGSNNGPCGRKR